MAFPMMSSTLGYLLPTSTPGLDHGHGITLGQDRYGGLVRIDVETNTEDCPNSNIFIAAESGSGKSTLAKDVILQERALYGAKVIVLGDPESEFGYFCMATGGSRCRAWAATATSRRSSRATSARPTTPPTTARSRATSRCWPRARPRSTNTCSRRRSRSSRPSCRWHSKGITDDLLDYLDIALEALYADHGIMVETTFREYYAGPMTYPNMRELYRSSSRSAGTTGPRPSRSGASRWPCDPRPPGTTRTCGTPARTSTPRRTSSCSTPRGYPKTRDQAGAILQPHHLGLVAGARAALLGQYVRLVADEIHTVMNRNSPDAANQIGNIAKRIRKYGGGLMCITQMITELMDPEIASAGRAVIYNSAYKFFGRSSGRTPAATSTRYRSCSRFPTTSR